MTKLITYIIPWTRYYGKRTLPRTRLNRDTPRSACCVGCANGAVRICFILQFLYFLLLLLLIQKLRA